MSLRSQVGLRAGQTSMIRKAARLVLYAGLATGLAGSLALGSTATANAAPVAQAHQHGGQPGRAAPWWGGSHFRHGYGGTLTGTVLSAPVASTALTTTASTIPVTASFTITPVGWQSSTVTVDVTANTKFRDPGDSSPSLSDVLLGDQVIVRGMNAGTDTVDASSVQVPLVFQTGTVLTMTATTTAPPTGAFTLATIGPKSTDVSVNVLSTTKFREPGVSSPGLSNVLVGDQVTVRGTQAGGGVVNATSIDVPLVTQTGTVLTGTATTISSMEETFTLAAGSWKSTNVTVDVFSTTTIRERGQSSVNFSDIQGGDQVTVVGTQGGGGVIDATSVLIRPAGRGHGFPSSSGSGGSGGSPGSGGSGGSPGFPGFPGGPGHHGHGR
jgi:hypothetical protein